MTQEFHISVTPVGVDEYLVRIEHSLPGVPVAEEQVNWPLDKWLAIARQLMNDPLSQLLQSNPSRQELSGQPTAEGEQPTLNLVALGKELYNALFQGSLRDSWMMAQAIAQNQRQQLRLRLGLKGSRLPSLPWEVLHDGYRTLATGTEVLFSRYWPPTNGLPVPPLPAPPTVGTRTLRILMVVAAPTDRESLELRQEATELQNELESRSDTGSIADIQLSILEQPDRAALTQALEQGQYQVLHYAGHSNLGNSGGAIYLVNSKTGRAEPLSGDDLAGLLVNNGIQMAVFNSCRGAYLRASGEVMPTGEGNLTEALVKRGIPAVLAMAESIPDEVALHLTRLFYRNLNQGQPIDLSLSRARQGLISSYSSHQLYWALPVLYVHPEFDGYLIRKSGVREREEPESFSPLTPVMPPMNLEKPIDRPIDDGALEGVLDELEYPDVMAGDEDDDAKAIVAELLGELAPPKSPDPPPEAGDAQAPETEESQVETEPEPEPLPQPLSAPEIGSAVVSTPEEVKIAEVPIDTTPLKPKSRSNIRWFVAAGAIALVGVGTVFYRQMLPPVAVVPDPPTNPNTNSNANSNTNPNPDPQPIEIEELASLESGVVAAEGIAELTDGNLESGVAAIEILLDRNALSQAKAVLATVPPETTNDPSDPTILFLQGRLAWQNIQTGDKFFTLDDVRRYWESSVRTQPNSVRYRQALGFAYYAQNQFDRAYESWQSARETIERGSATDERTGQPIDFAPNSEMALQIDAGLALALMKSARAGGQNPQQKLTQAIALRQQVLSTAPDKFTTDALAKNWLWTQEALRDWQALLQLQS